MIIDCHYHLETRMQPVENLILKMEANGIEKTALMPTIWDVPPHTPEFLLKLLRFLLYHRFLRTWAKKSEKKYWGIISKSLSESKQAWNDFSTPLQLQ